LAISIDGKLQILLEGKAIGLDLKDSHVKQAVDYAANQGLDWVILTNGNHWRLYKVSFGKPIDQDLVLEIDMLQIAPKAEADLNALHLLTKEAWQKKMIIDFAAQKQVLSRFFIAGMVLTEPVLDVIRRELKRTWPDVKIKTDQIESVLRREVLRPD